MFLDDVMLTCEVSWGGNEIERYRIVCDNKRLHSQSQKHQEKIGKQRRKQLRSKQHLRNWIETFYMKSCHTNYETGDALERNKEIQIKEQNEQTLKFVKRKLLLNELGPLVFLDLKGSWKYLSTVWLGWDENCHCGSS